MRRWMLIPPPVLVPPDVGPALRRLAALHAAGRISDEEYARQRGEILDQAAWGHPARWKPLPLSKPVAAVLLVGSLAFVGYGLAGFIPQAASAGGFDLLAGAVWTLLVAASALYSLLILLDRPIPRILAALAQPRRRGGWGRSPALPDFEAALRQLAALHDDDLISDEEYAHKRAELLAPRPIVVRRGRGAARRPEGRARDAPPREGA